MLTRELLDYLQQCKTQSIPLSQIEMVLRQNKWDENTIIEAKTWYSGGVNSSFPSSLPNQNPVHSVQNPVQNTTSNQSSQTPLKDPNIYVFNSNPMPGAIGTQASQTSSQSSNTTIHPLTESGGGKGKIVFISLLLILFLFILSGGFFVSVAYGQVSLGNKDFQRKAADVVMSIPFFPKTPEFLLRKSFEAHAKLQRATIDLSFAISSQDISKLLGFGKFDMQVKGPIDYKDPENPEVDLNIFVTKDFNMDLIVKDKTSYFRINVLPPLVGTYLKIFGLDESYLDTFMKKWFYYDISALETDARKDLEENEKDSREMNEDTEKILSLLDNKKIKDNLTITNEIIDDFSTYKIQLNATKDVIDTIERSYGPKIDIDNTIKLGKKTSEILQDMRVNVWFDKKDYYIRKFSLSFDVKMDDPSMGSTLESMSGIPLSSKNIPMSISFRLSKFNESTNIEAPKDAVKFEDFLNQIINEEIEISTRSSKLYYN